MVQNEFKKANFAKLFNYNVFFDDYLQYIRWAVKNSKTMDMLTQSTVSENEYGPIADIWSKVGVL